jgi:predicted amidohydrolase
MGKIGIVVCFDRHYPESVRTSALGGAELVLIPTANTKDEPSKLFQWEIKIQAFQNSVNIAMCNRVGREGEMDFSGESIVSDYNGETLALADDSEQLLYAEVDLPAARKTRERKPYTSLRRPELYA